MVHSFTTKVCNNGNVHVLFFQDSKKRKIILERDTQALSDFYEPEYEDLSIKDTIIQLRDKSYDFKVNPNNKSIFRPVERELAV